MTSNLGSHLIEEIDQREEGNEKRTQQVVMDELRRHFKPEFLNRVDEIVVFKHLEREQIRSIVDIQLARMSKMLEERSITLTLTDAAKDFLAGEGFDPAYGARPLKRAIQRHVQNRLAQAVLAGDVADGDNVTFDVGEAKDELVVKV
jgi:ATP-dependent Clp protease ATP-binding subunit ClpB